MPDETIGDVEHVVTADHPPRTNSPKYNKTRKWLMGEVAGGCWICGGPVDLSHPEAPADAKGLQDHHGGGIYLYQENKPPILVGLNLFGLEWSLGWSANPVMVQKYVTQLNEVTTRLGGEPYSAEIASVQDVMNYLDSPLNANVKMCSVHHVGHEDKHTLDINGHQGVGIHTGPVPIWLGQATCDWANWDMWGGTTGTLAVAPSKTTKGGATVLYVSPLHRDATLYQEHRESLAKGVVLELPPHHENARLACAGAFRHEATQETQGKLEFQP